MRHEHTNAEAVSYHLLRLKQDGVFVKFAVRHVLVGRLLVGVTHARQLLQAHATHMHRLCPLHPGVRAQLHYTSAHVEMHPAHLCSLALCIQLLF